jgi:homoserine dehydrogenase
MLPQRHPLAMVDGAFNALDVVGNAVGSTMFYGLGAGAMPTGSAVVSDLMEIARDMLSGSTSRAPVAGFRDPSRLPIRRMGDVTSCYYLRFAAIDRPGVLSRISGVLGKNNISIRSVIQQGRRHAEAVPLVMMTHDAVERDVQRALNEISSMDCVEGPTMLIRVGQEEDGD